MSTLLMNLDNFYTRMSTTDPTHDQEHETAVTIPTTLDSSGSKLVYLYLSTVDEATIEDLQTTLEMQQIALFPVLETLESADLVDHDGMTYTTAA
jgi:predicted transcriptional regulator